MKPVPMFRLMVELLIGVPALVPPSEAPMTLLSVPEPLVVRTEFEEFWVSVWLRCVPTPVPPAKSPPMASVPLVARLPSVTTLVLPAPVESRRLLAPATRRVPFWIAVPTVCVFAPVRIHSPAPSFWRPSVFVVLPSAMTPETIFPEVVPLRMTKRAVVLGVRLPPKLSVPPLEVNWVLPPPEARVKLPLMALLPARFTMPPTPVALLVDHEILEASVMLPPEPSSRMDALLPAVLSTIEIVLGPTPSPSLLVMTRSPAPVPIVTFPPKVLMPDKTSFPSPALVKFPF